MTTVERLRSPVIAESLAAIGELVARGAASPTEIAALVEALGNPHKVVQRRAAEALATLHAHGVAVEAALRAALEVPPAAQRWGAAYALSLIGTAPPQALPALLEALGSGDGDVRWATATIVARMIRTPELVAALQHLLAHGAAAQRKMAAYCLRDLDARSPVVEQALYAALDDADFAVRIAAMSSLARLCADRVAAAQRVVLLLDGPDAGVRRAAAAVLGSLGERSDAVLAGLRRVAAGVDPSLRRAAVRSLRLLGA